MFYSLVLSKRQSINMLSLCGVIFHLFQEILSKKQQLAEADDVAEAEGG